MKKIVAVFFLFLASFSVANAEVYNDSLCFDSTTVRVDSLEQQTVEQGGSYFLAYWGFIFFDMFNNAEDATLKVNISPIGDISNSTVWVEIWTLQQGDDFYEKLYTSIAVSGNTIIDDTTVTFDLSGFTFENGVKYGVVLNTDLLYSTENYYGVYVNCPDDTPVLVSRWFINDGTYWFGTDINASFEMYTAGETTPTATTSESTSTVQAIYTVGNSIQIYFGIMIMLLFGYMSYKFTRPYLT